MVSVIIPVYNRGNIIAAAVNSVLNQTYTDLWKKKEYATHWQKFKRAHALRHVGKLLIKEYNDCYMY